MVKSVCMTPSLKKKEFPTFGQEGVLATLLVHKKEHLGGCILASKLRNVWNQQIMEKRRERNFQ